MKRIIFFSVITILQLNKIDYEAIEPGNIEKFK